jgi:hypothetical protein
VETRIFVPLSVNDIDTTVWAVRLKPFQSAQFFRRRFFPLPKRRR